MSGSTNYEQTQTPEWSCLIDTSEVEETPVRVSIKADETEKQNLARRLNVAELQNLQADVELSREYKWIIHVTGRLSADVTQSCVVTFEPVTYRIEETFEGWFANPDQVVSFVKARHEREKKYGEGERPMLEEYEDPEPLVDGNVDVGELASQYLSLAIDPYPRAPGVDLVGEDPEEQLKRDKENPFAALQALKKDNNQDS